MKEKRYVATYTMYIYAKDENHARSKAKMIENREKTKYPSQDCALEKSDLEKLEYVPFGAFPQIEPISLENTNPKESLI